MIWSDINAVLFNANLDSDCSISLLTRASRSLNICPAVKDPIDAVLLDF